MRDNAGICRYLGVANAVGFLVTGKVTGRDQPVMKERT